MSAEKFEEVPIIFGDFLKVGAAQSDRMYEELVNMKKVGAVLNEVSGTCTGTSIQFIIAFHCPCSILMIST